MIHGKDRASVLAQIRELIATLQLQAYSMRSYSATSNSNRQEVIMHDVPTEILDLTDRRLINRLQGRSAHQ